MNQQNRTCEFIINDKAYQGTFHLFGITTKFCHVSSETYQITVAIVEGIDGQVHMVAPNKIKFINP